MTFTSYWHFWSHSFRQLEHYGTYYASVLAIPKEALILGAETRGVGLSTMVWYAYIIRLKALIGPNRLYKRLNHGLKANYSSTSRQTVPDPSSPSQFFSNNISTSLFLLLLNGQASDRFLLFTEYAEGHLLSLYHLIVVF